MFRLLRTVRRTLALSMGIFLLQAFLAPGDLACALRHHAQQGPADMQGMAAGHEAGHPAGHSAEVVDHAGSQRAPTPADHCADPSRGHCDWMSACAPVALMVVSTEALAEQAIPAAAPVANHVPLFAGISLAPDVPPPRG